MQILLTLIIIIVGCVLYICDSEKAKRAQREEDCKHPILWALRGGGV